MPERNKWSGKWPNKWPHKWLNKWLSCLLAAVMILAQAYPAAPVLAEVLAVPQTAFHVTENDTGIALDGVDIKVYTDAEHKMMLTGSLGRTGLDYVFTASSPLESTEMFYFTAEKAGYKNMEGTTYFGPETILNVPMTKEDKQSALATRLADYTMDYGTEADAGVLYTTVDGYTGSITCSVASGSSVVVEDGKIKAVSLGSSTLKLTMQETETCKAEEVLIPVTVREKAVGSSENGAFTWNGVVVTYGNSNAVTVSGTYRDMDIAEGAELKATGMANLTGLPAGVHAVTLTDVQVELPSGYALAENTTFNTTAEITILKKDIQIPVNTFTAEYGKEEWSVLSQQGVPEAWTGASIWDTSALSPEIAAELVPELNAATSLANNHTEFPVGLQENGLVLVLDGSKLTNYHPVLTSEYVPVNITNEVVSDAWSQLELDAQNSYHVSADANGIYAAPGGSAVFKVKDGGRYDSVAITTDMGVSYHPYIAIPADAAGGPVSGSLYLYRQDDPATRTTEMAGGDVTDSKIPANTVIVDGTAPDVTIAGLTGYTSSKETTNKTVLFEKYLRDHGQEVDVTAEDTQSGIAGIWYRVAKVANDEDVAREIARTEMDIWRELPAESKIYIPEGTEEGYYLLLVRAEDKVGNVSVFASNGTVMDITAPAVEIRGIEDGAVYSGDVNYDIVYRDTATGVSTIQALVVVDGKDIPVSTGNENSFVINKVTADSPAYSFGEIAEETGEKTFSGKITASAANSNDVQLEVTVVDYAGNSTTITRRFAIDVSDKAIRAAYDNNDVRNGKYFIKSRTLTATFQDRNFQEENVILNLTAGNTKGSYSIADIRNNQVPGVKLSQDAADSQAGMEAKDYTNERTVTYALTFGADTATDMDFAVDIAMQTASGAVHCSDFDGAAAPAAFIIDNIAPSPSIVLTDGFGEVFQSGTEGNPVYKNGPVVAELRVSERNPDTAKTQVTLTQTDAGGEDAAAYPVELTTKPSQNPWMSEAESLVSTYKMDAFAGDANYGISMRVMDLAGNAADTGSAMYFTVDTKSPELQLFVGDEAERQWYREFLEKLTFGMAKNHSIPVGHEANDATTAVRSVKYYIHIPEEETRGAFDALTAEELRAVQWTDWTENLSIDPDSQAVVYARAEDLAGNITYVNSEGGLIADQTDPYRPVLTIKNTNGADGVYPGDVIVEVQAGDQAKGGTYAGLASVSWEVWNGQEKTQEGSFDERYGLSDISQRLKSLTDTITVEADKNNGNDIRLVVRTEDHAGNMSSEELKLRIDATPGTLTGTYDNNDVRNGQYFNKDRILTLTVRERDFEEQQLLMDISVNGEKHECLMSDIRDGKIPHVYLAQDAIDSQQDVETASRTDERTVTYQIGFGSGSGSDTEKEQEEEGKPQEGSPEEEKMPDPVDADFTFAAHLTDAAGNKTDDIDFGSSAAPDKFTIDQVAPVYGIAYTDAAGNEVKPGKDAGSTAYAASPVTAGITVTERNFAPARTTAELTQTDAAGNAVEAYAASSLQALSVEEWKKGEGNTHTFTMAEFAGDARYSLLAGFEDLAGNRAEMEAPDYFVVDTTAPVLRIAVNDNETKTWFEQLFEKVFFWTFRSHSVQIVKTAEDATSGIASVKYYIHHPDAEASGAFDALTINDLANVTWTDWDEDPRVDPDSQAIVYARVEDMAGNTAFVNTRGGVVADMTDPEAPDIKILSPDNGSGVYNNHVDVNITANDPKSGETYAGLADVTWQVLSDGVVTQSGSFKEKYGLSDRTQRLQFLTDTITVDAAKNNSNNVTIRATAIDYAGNTHTSQKSLMVDITNPTLTASFDNNDVQNGKYFRADRIMTLTVQERNFNEGNFALHIRSGETESTYSMEEIRSGSVPHVWIQEDATAIAGSTPDGSKIVYRIGFGANGGEPVDSDFAVSGKFTDNAGNRVDAITFVDSASPEEFVIDEIAPVYNIRYTDGDGQEAQAGSREEAPLYDAKQVSAALEVTERNLDTGKTEIVLTQTDYEGRPVSAYSAESVQKPKTGRWGKDGLFQSFVMDAFDKDANYSLDASFTDLAGNRSAANGAGYFTVDTTAPSLRISVDDEETGEWFENIFRTVFFRTFRNRSVRVIQESGDGISGIKSLQFYIYNPDVESRDSFAGLTEAELASVSWKDWSGDVTVDPDAQAIVYARVEDMAGNVSFAGTRAGIVADATAPYAPSLTPVTAASAAGIYSGDVEVQINAGDVEEGGTYAGLKDVQWQVTSNGIVTQSGSFRDKYDMQNRTHRLQSITDTIKVEADKNNSNDVKVRVVSTDYADNTASAEIPLMIDTTPAVMTASYDNNDARNGHYFNADRAMTLVIRERNYDENLVVLSIGSGSTSGQYSIEDIRAGKVPNVKLLEDAKDSQQGLYTDARTISYVIGFGANGGNAVDVDFTAAASMSDAAGNRTEGIVYSETAAASPESFTVDEILPEYEIAYADGNGNAVKAGTAKESPLYSNTQVKGTLKIRERNFTGSTASLTLAQTDYEGRNVNTYSTSSLEAPSKGEWTDGAEDIHTFRLDPFRGDANYALEAVFTDLAGNTSAPKGTDYFTVDRTAPTARIAVDDSETKQWYEKLYEKVFFWTFRTHSVPLAQENADATSGIRSVAYYIDHPAVSQKGTFDALTAEELASVEWKAWSQIPRISPDGQAIAYMRVEDMAGNVTLVNTEGGVVADATAPDAPVITILTKDNGSGIYTGDVDLKIEVKDPENGGTYAGFKNVSWQIVCDGKTTQEGNFNEKYKLSDRTARVQSITETIRAEAAKNNSNDVLLRVDTEDYAGNTASAVKAFMIDTTKGTITASYDNNDVRNERYFNADRVMTLTVQERNYSEGLLALQISSGGTVGTYSIKEIGEGRIPGVYLAGDMIDTQAGRDASALTDERTITYRIGFGSNGRGGVDNDYTFAASVEDRGGNRTDTVDFMQSVSPASFTVDEIKPVYQVIYTDGGGMTTQAGTAQGAPLYDNRRIGADIQVQERNFTAGGVTVSLTQTDLAGTPLGVYPASYVQAPSLGPWSPAGLDTQVFHMIDFTGDANYSMDVSVTDLAGNTADPEGTRYFTVDTTAPQASLTVHAEEGAATYSGLFQSIWFWFMQRGAIPVTHAESDATSGIRSVRYYIDRAGVNSAGILSGYSISQMESLPWTDWAGTIGVSPDSQGFVYARVEDMAGNITYLNTEGGLIADSTAPAVPAITIQTQPGGGNIFTGDVNVEIRADETVNGDTYSGLQSVTWQVTNNGTVTQSGNINGTLGDRRNRVYSVSDVITISAQANNSNNVRLEVTATDYAGNVSTATRDLQIDITRPRIEVTYDNNAPANGRYFNRPRTATVTVYERNFDPSGVEWSITGTEGKMPVIGAWNISPQAGVSDDAMNTCTVVFSEDADYTLTLAVNDIAGNRTVFERTDSFTIDRTNPEVAITSDASNENGYYNKTRTLQVEVTEKNFSPDAVILSARGVLDDKEVETPQITEWREADGKHVATLVFENEGEYRVSVQVTDLALNGPVSAEEKPFIIDKTSPKLEITGIKNRSANKGEVRPVIEYSDRNLDEEKVVLILDGKNHKKKRPSGKYVPAEGGGRFTLDDIEHIAAADDIYTLTAAVTDKAGNETRRVIEFSVNRFGSNYTFDEDTEKLLEAFYTKDAPTVTIYETNVNTLKNNGIRVSIDGVVKTLKEGVDYQVTKRSLDNGWTRYAYVISRNVFGSEGVYEILIDSEDAAGNRQDNKLKEMPVTFAIDKTAPSVVITGIEDGERYKETTRTIDIHVSDNFLAKSVTLYVNEAEAATFTEEDIEEGEGVVSYELKESADWQVIRAVATDAAGNEAESDVKRVLITTNSLRQALNSRALPIALIGIFSAAAALAIILILAKRQKEKEE